jgi:hypothetical protein
MHIRELDQDTWPALERLFGPNGADVRGWIAVAPRTGCPVNTELDRTSRIGSGELYHGTIGLFTAAGFRVERARASGAPSFD